MSRHAAQSGNRHIVDEAANWLARLHSPGFTERDRQALEQWCRQSSEHQRVWHSAEQLTNKFCGIAPGLAMPVLDRPRNVYSRRAMLKTVALAAVVPSGVWLGIKLLQDDAGVTYKTATGERRTIGLDDGSTLALNTGTTVQVRFDASQRALYQRTGELLIQTAADPAATKRPFIVQTDDGSLRALGTRFIVRKEERGTRLSVLEDAVEVSTAGAQTTRIVEAGQQVVFTSQAIGEVTPLAVGIDAWLQGVIYAQNMPLQDFVTELRRYRPGIVRCDPAIAHLTVSGAFHIADTDRILTLLSDTLPIKIVMLSRYWVTLSANT